MCPAYFSLPAPHLSRASTSIYIYTTIYSFFQALFFHFTQFPSILFYLIPKQSCLTTKVSTSCPGSPLILSQTANPTQKKGALGGLTDTVGKTGKGLTDTVGNTVQGVGKGASDTVNSATKGVGDTTKGMSKTSRPGRVDSLGKESAADGEKQDLEIVLRALPEEVQVVVLLLVEVTLTILVCKEG